MNRRLIRESNIFSLGLPLCPLSTSRTNADLLTTIKRVLLVVSWSLFRMQLVMLQIMHWCLQGKRYQFKELQNQQIYFGRIWELNSWKRFGEDFRHFSTRSSYGLSVSGLFFLLPSTKKILGSREVSLQQLRQSFLMRRELLLQLSILC